MRCIQCDKELTDFEATRKDVRDNSYLDLCNLCFSYVSQFIPVLERYDLYEGEDDTNDDDESQVRDLWIKDES